MSKKTIAIIVVSIAATILLVIFFGWAAGSIAAFLSSFGARKAFSDYRKVEIHRQQKEEMINRQVKQDLAHEISQEFDLVEVKKQVAKDEPNVHKKIDSAKSLKQLQEIEAAQLDDSEKWLKRQGGFSKVATMLIILFASIGLSYIATASSPLDKQKSIAHKRAKVIKRYQLFIVKLKREKIALKKKLIRAQANIDIRDARIAELSAKRAIVAKIPCPPTWHNAVIATVITTFIVAPIGLTIGHTLGKGKVKK